LALTFANPSDFEKIREEDKISVLGLKTFSPERGLTIRLNHKDGSHEDIKVKHSYNAEQIEWFRAGSALNMMGD
jgi:aconitate hydratase